MRILPPSSLVIAGLWGAYLIAATAVLAWSVVVLGSGLQTQLGGLLSRPLVALAVLAPIVLGLLVQMIGRRFWAWPYVYLLVFALVLSGDPRDFVDQAYAYASLLVWVFTVFVAESVGLSLGRWLHRFVGIAFFIGAGGWMLIKAFTEKDPSLVARWQALILALAGGLFLIHAGIQLYNYRRSLETQAAESEPEPVEATEPAPPEPTVGESEGPWRVVSAEQPPAADQSGDNGDNKQHD
ncbi:hypothetical protein JW859_07535 [bacterium]|nr:hypothetical protein [bacterium]